MTSTAAEACPSCGTGNRPGRKFCANCGTALGMTCPSCGTPYEEGDKFCGECGTRLGQAPAPAAQPPADREAELRQVSVVFCDIVGYTSLAEARDAEDVRDLLSGYFDTATRVVDRYGGTVEKFIGDAVMAVWGSPIAREDDAERSVRAALDLVTEVAAYGESVGLPGLQARAGVVTGQAAAIVDPREGLVVGDRVNTAARVQATAEPGAVYVDTATKELTAAAIAFADTGEHELKGKAEPLRLWRAVRVVGSVGGVERIDGLEAAFVGRARELVLLKELFHGSAEDRRARLVSVMGQAGVGKSRLKWELEKYIDGLALQVRWHSGRCLSYGEGVAYWALTQMLRQRFDIDEEDPSDLAGEKVASGLERWVDDPAAREFLLPRLSVLVGTSSSDFDPEDLFAGWRLLFEQLALDNPVALVFEDMQWADAGLLDFIEQLLDWSAEHPIFILTMSRPELLERRPGWASGRRNATSIYLDPLPEPAMYALLDDLVPNLPREVVDDVVAKAEGVPLYAVETIRMLVDRECILPTDGVYTLVGEVGRLEVPASLTALIRARIDALDPAERSLVKDLSVLGTTFARSAILAITDRDEAEIDQLLQSLVRKEVLAVRSDPLSAERGQYAFEQGLLRTVSYETISRRDRKIRHLRVAAHLRNAFDADGEDVAELIAAHYRDALRAGLADPDADEIRGNAVEMYTRAAHRAAAIGAPEAALQAYLIAAELCEDEEQATGLTATAARMALLAARHEQAVELYERAIAAHQAAGRDAELAPLAEGYGVVLGQVRRTDEAITWQRQLLTSLSPDDPNRGEVLLSLARSELFSGDTVSGQAHVDEAMRVAEDFGLPEVIAIAAAVKALWAATDNRLQEALLLFRWALELLGEDGSIREQLSARVNRGDLLLQSDLPHARDDFERVIALASRAGDRFAESLATANLILLETFEGSWVTAAGRGHALLKRRSAIHEDRRLVHFVLGHLALLRGRLDEGEQHAAELLAWRDSDDVQNATNEAALSGLIAFAKGDLGAALERAGEAARISDRGLGPRSESFRMGWPLAVEAALSLGDLEQADALMALLKDRPAGHVPPFLRALLSRFRGLIRGARGDHSQVEADLTSALEQMTALRYPYWRARVQTDLAGWLVSQARADEAHPLLAEAERTASELGAAPLLEHITQVSEGSSRGDAESALNGVTTSGR